MRDDTLATGHPAPPPSRRPLWQVWLLVFLASFLLYALTANRGVQWQDSGSHILRITNHQVHNPLGLALAHPLHHWICRAAIAIEVGEPCFIITLVSSLFAAITVANVFGAVRAFTYRSTAAVWAAASLGLAHTFWQMATLTETYTLCTALLSGEFWLLTCWNHTGQRRYFWGLALLNGFGVANHLLAGLITPVWVFVIVYAIIRRRAPLSTGIAAAVFWLAGTLPYSSLVVAELIQTGDWAGTFKSALFGHRYAGYVLNMTISPRVVMVSVGFVALNLPNLLLPLSGYGLFIVLRRSPNRLIGGCLLASLIIYACFAFRYSVSDQYMFLLPWYVLVCICGGFGFAFASEWATQHFRRLVLASAVVLLLTTPIIYAVAPSIAKRYGLLDRVARYKPYRDDYVYLLTPWSVAERSAETMAAHAMRLAEPNGLIIVEDSMAAFAVRYKIARSGSQSISVTCPGTSEEIVGAIQSGRPVVLVPATVGKPRIELRFGTWSRQGDLYILDTTEDTLQSTDG